MTNTKNDRRLAYLIHPFMKEIFGMAKFKNVPLNVHYIYNYKFNSTEDTEIIHDEYEIAECTGVKDGVYIKVNKFKDTTILNYYKTDKIKFQSIEQLKQYVKQQLKSEKDEEKFEIYFDSIKNEKRVTVNILTLGYYFIKYEVLSREEKKDKKNYVADAFIHLWFKKEDMRVLVNESFYEKIKNKKHKEDKYKDLSTDYIYVRDLAQQYFLYLLENGLDIVLNKKEYDCSDNNITIKDHNIIFFGPPGTGKSHKIKKELESNFSKVIRTTFHPEYTYYDFVGQYKPCTGYLSSKDIFLDNENKVYFIPKDNDKEIIGEVRNYKLDSKNVIDFKLIQSRYNTEMAEELSTLSANTNTSTETSVKLNYAKPLVYYDFIPGPFIEAVCVALEDKTKTDNGEDKKPVLLVIEEINRGNTAAIFGDIFQLLDRKKGKSEYEITLPIETKEHIKKKLEWNESDWDDYFREGFYIPDNLYIYATMNTSVESIYPMDSAFKRRWHMEYIPIKYKDVKYDEMQLDNVYVEDPNNNDIKWLDLIGVINEVIREEKTEDKQIGQYFILPKGGKIEEEDIKNKLLEYLWFYVFRFGKEYIFKVNIKSFDKLLEQYNDDGEDRSIIKGLFNILNDNLVKALNGEITKRKKSSDESSDGSSGDNEE